MDVSNRCQNDHDFIFYNNLKHPSGALLHTGDNRTGEGDGDDEQVIVDFSKIPAYVDRIGITVTIHDAEARSQNFGQVSNAFVRLRMKQQGKNCCVSTWEKTSLLKRLLCFVNFTGMGLNWKFNAIGSGFSGGLAALCQNYGLDV